MGEASRLPPDSFGRDAQTTVWGQRPQPLESDQDRALQAAKHFDRIRAVEHIHLSPSRSILLSLQSQSVDPELAPCSEIWNIVRVIESFGDKATEKLWSGKRAGQHSIRINNQWRLCFRWAGGNACEVEITDYH